MTLRIKAATVSSYINGAVKVDWTPEEGKKSARKEIERFNPNSRSLGLCLVVGDGRKPNESHLHILP